MLGLRYHEVILWLFLYFCSRSFTFNRVGDSGTMWGKSACGWTAFPLTECCHNTYQRIFIYFRIFQNICYSHGIYRLENYRAVVFLESVVVSIYLTALFDLMLDKKNISPYAGSGMTPFAIDLLFWSTFDSWIIYSRRSCWYEVRCN